MSIGYYIAKRPQKYCSEAGDQIIDNKRECKGAALTSIKAEYSNADFKRQIENEERPTGCFWSDYTKRLYFNTAEDIGRGMGNKKIRQVCKTTGT